MSWLPRRTLMSGIHRAARSAILAPNGNVERSNDTLLTCLQVEEKKAATEVLLEEMSFQRAGAGEKSFADTILATAN